VELNGIRASCTHSRSSGSVSAYGCVITASDHELGGDEATGERLGVAGSQGTIPA
jgi:hypothetical protein